MQNIELREVRAEDVEFLFRLMNDASLRRALGEPATQRSDWEEAIQAWSQDADEEGYIVRCQGKAAGWFAVNGLLAEDSAVFLKMAALLPEYQNRGIGSAVLSQLLERLRVRGFRTVLLFTDRGNALARGCYAKCGFRVVETLTEQLSDGRSAPRVRMECIIEDFQRNNRKEDV